MALLCGTTEQMFFNFSNEQEQRQWSGGRGAQVSGANIENPQPPGNNAENAQVGANYVPLDASLAVLLNPDLIMASGAGGMFTFSSRRPICYTYG